MVRSFHCESLVYTESLGDKKEENIGHNFHFVYGLTKLWTIGLEKVCTFSLDFHVKCTT